MTDFVGELAARIDAVLPHFEIGTTNEMTAPLIHELSSRVALFPAFFQYLPDVRDLHRIQICLTLLKALICRRGCLLSAEALANGVLGPLMELWRSVPSDFFQVPSFTSLICQSIATAYRLLFERSDGAATFEELFEMVARPPEDRPDFPVLGLIVMTAIVERFKEKMAHLTDATHRVLALTFRNTTLFRYFHTACQCLNSPSPDLLSAAMDLLFACLQYDTKSDVLDDTYQFTVPQDMIGFCMSTEVPRELFRIYHAYFSDPAKGPVTKATRVLDILPYFSASGTSQGTVAQLATPRLTYLDFIARELKDIVISDGLPMEHVLGLSRLLLKVAFLIPVVEFLGLDVAWEFFANVHAFSCRLFGELGSPDLWHSCMNMLKFWAKLGRVGPGRARELPAPYVEFFQTVFSAFVEGLLAPVPALASEFRQCEHFETRTFVGDVAPLWGVAEIVPQHATEVVRGLMDRLTADLVGGAASAATAHRLALLVLTVAARIDVRTFSLVVGADAVSQLASLISGVLALVAATDGRMDVLAASLGESLEVLEGAITHFVVLFRRDYLGEPKPITNHVYAALVPPGTRQDVFNLFVDRFLRDLRTLVHFPQLLGQILDFLHALLTPSEGEATCAMAASHALLQGLTHRELFLDFSGVDPAQSRRLLLVLNKIYAKSIKTASGWMQFLDHFDSRFAAIAGGAYAHEHQIFCLYQEIYGMLRGLSSYRDYLIVFRWFMGRHVEDTLSAIRAQAQRPLVAHAVARAWYLLASNKGKKLILPSASAEGIQLFRESLRVIGALIQCLDESNDQKYLICKIIRPSLSETYANFGVMELYGDTSLDEMLAVFFRIIATWEFSEISQLRKGVRVILETIEAVLATRPNRLDDARLALVTQFIAQTLLWQDESKFDVKWSSTQNCFRLACKCLQQLMLFCLGRSGVDWALFRRHFIAITDQLCHPKYQIADPVAGPLCYCVKMDPAFVQSVFQGVYESFDEQYRSEIQAIVEQALSVVDRVTAPDQLQRFRAALNNFQRDIMRYSIELAEVPGIADFFRM
jgi:hypothetical protein